MIECLHHERFFIPNKERLADFFACQSYAENLSGFDKLIVPLPYDDFSTARVLTMQYVPGRKDQGRDGQTNPGGAIVADGNGFVVNVLSDPNGFGPRYPLIHFTSGPYAGLIPDVAPPEQRGSASGWMAVMQAVGTVLGAFSAGYLIARPNLTIRTSLGEDRMRVNSDQFMAHVGLVYSVF